MHPADFSPFSPVRLALVLGALAVGLTGCAPKSNAPATVAVPAVPTFAVVETDKGTFEFELLSADAPKGTENFRLLAARGYYNGLTFHRIIKGFMIQGGCPNTKKGGKGMPGTGGPGHTIKAQFNAKPHVRGVLSMARSSHPDSAGSQFFICHGDARFRGNAFFQRGLPAVALRLMHGNIPTFDEIATIDDPTGIRGAAARVSDRRARAFALSVQSQCFSSVSSARRTTPLAAL